MIFKNIEYNSTYVIRIPCVKQANYENQQFKSVGGGRYLTDMFVTKLTFVSSWSYHDAADSVCVCVCFSFTDKRGWLVYDVGTFQSVLSLMYISYIYHIPDTGSALFYCSQCRGSELKIIRLRIQDFVNSTQPIQTGKQNIPVVSLFCL